MAVRACSARSSAPRPAARSAPRSTATAATYAAARLGLTPDEGRPRPGGALFSFAGEEEGGGGKDAGEGGGVAPVERLAEDQHHEAAEHDQRDRLLRDLKLAARPAGRITQAV